MVNGKRLAVAAMLLTMALAGCGKSTRSNYEKAGGYSYDPPSGWDMVDFPGLKYKIARGPMTDGFAANINVVDETAPVELDDYVSENIKAMKRAFSSMTIESQKKLTTDDGKPMAQMVVEDEQMGHLLRQTFYFCANGNRKYVITCSALSKGGKTYDAAFETCAKSFRTH